MSVEPKSLVEGVAFPPLLLGPAASLAALMSLLESTERWPPERLAARQLDQLALLAAHAAASSPSFRERLGAAGLRASDLTSFARLRELPPLTRRDVQRAGPSLFSEGVPAAHRPIDEQRTSGSTGEPVVVRRTSVTRMLWMATTMRDHRWHRRDLTQRLSSIRASIAEYKEQATWGPPASLLFTTGRAQAIPITTSIDEQLGHLLRFRPRSLIVYPSNLLALAEAVRARGVKLDELEHVRTIGETLSPRVRAVAEEVLGAKVEDSYSSNELGNIAHQCEAGLYHAMAEHLIVEVLDERGEPCADGEVGRIVVTDLANFATPLLRYEIGDYAERAGDCACGRTLPTLRRIVGRERNLILMPDGSRHFPLVGFASFRAIAPIAQYQLVQRTREAIEVRLACDAPLTSSQEAELCATIRAALGHPFELAFVYFDGAIPRGSAGKFEEFIGLAVTR